MGKYDEALSKSLQDRLDPNAARRLNNVAGEEMYGGNAVVRTQVAIARNRGRTDVADLLEKSIRPTQAKTEETLEKSVRSEELFPMEESFKNLERLSKGLVSVQTETPHEELDRLRRENRLLKNTLQMRSQRKKAPKKVIQREEGQKYRFV